MRHFLSLLRVHFVWSVNVWKALKRYFSKRTTACQKNHGGSLARAFDLICRSVVLLWHFRQNSGWGQTNHLWYSELAHFTFYLCLAIFYATCASMWVWWQQYLVKTYSTLCKLVTSGILIVSTFLFSPPPLFSVCMHTSLSHMWDVWAKPLCHQL